MIKNLVEQIAFEARQSEYIDSKSGVSARLTISALRKSCQYCRKQNDLINNEKETTVIRISDLYGVIPSITGKVELVYEGEQEGPLKVANILISKTIKSKFEEYFPSPDKLKKNQELNPYQAITNWFSKGNVVDILNSVSNKEYEKSLFSVYGLKDLVNKYFKKEDDTTKILYMEFLLHGLSEYSLLSKFRLESGIQFKDMISSMFTMDSEEDDEDITGTDYFR